jgi:hypothetical protein
VYRVALGYVKSMSAYPQFLAGFCNDGHGRRCSELITRDDMIIEHDCTALQWLFPTHERSPIEPDAWTLDIGDIYYIQRDARAKIAHAAAVARMKLFYEERDWWLTVGDHNHKRITRIIMNISLVSGIKEARKFHWDITMRNAQAGSPVNPTTIEFWRKAAGL